MRAFPESRDDEIAAVAHALRLQRQTGRRAPAPPRHCFFCLLGLAMLGVGAMAFLAVHLVINEPHHIPPWAHFVILAGAGGVASYLNLFREGHGWRTSQFAAHTVVSTFAGVILALTVEAAGLSKDFVPLACLIGGWMGARGVALAERVLENMTGGRKS